MHVTQTADTWGLFWSVHMFEGAAEVRCEDLSRCLLASCPGVSASLTAPLETGRLTTRWNQNIWTELLYVRLCSGCPRDLRASLHSPSLAALWWLSMAVGATIKSPNRELLWHWITIQHQSYNSTHDPATQVVNTQLTLADVSFQFILCCCPPIKYLCSDQVDLESQPQSSAGQEIIILSCLSAAFSLFSSLSMREKFIKYRYKTEWKNIFAAQVRAQVEVRQEGKLPEGSRASVSAHLPNKRLQLFYFWIIRSVQVTRHNDNKHGTRREVESIWKPSCSSTGDCSIIPKALHTVLQPK